MEYKKTVPGEMEGRKEGKKERKTNGERKNQETTKDNLDILAIHANQYCSLKYFRLYWNVERQK